MPYNFAADSFHTKKLCSRLSSSEVQFFLRKSAVLRFWGNVRRPSLAHWKAHSGLPISINWTFFARCYGWRARSDYWLKIGDFATTGAGWPKISGRRGLPYHPFFFSENKAKCSFVWYINLHKSFYCFVTIHACDWQTDGQTEFSSLDRVYIPCIAVKN